MKYCGKCGTQNHDNVMRCAMCGAFFTDMTNSQQQHKSDDSYHDGYNNYGNGSEQYSGSSNVVYQRIGGDDKHSAGAVIVKVLQFMIVAVIGLGLLVGAAAVYEYSDYRGTVRYFETYFDDYEYSKIVDMYSDDVFYNADPDDNYAELDEETKQKLEHIYEYFDDELGTKDYNRLKFKTVDNYSMSDSEYYDRIDKMTLPDKRDIVSDARIVKIKITASANGKQATKNIKLILTLENNDSWRVYSFEEV